MKTLKSMYARALAATLVAAASLPVLAGGVDYSDLTEAISFTGIAAIVVTAAGAAMAIVVIIKGIRWVFSIVKSA